LSHERIPQIHLQTEWIQRLGRELPWPVITLAAAAASTAYVIGSGLAWSQAFIAWPARYPAPIPVGDHLQTAYYLWLWRHALETMSHRPWTDPFQFVALAPATHQPFGWPLILVSLPVDWLAGPVAAYNALVLVGFLASALAAGGWAFELTKSRSSAVVAGLAFALAPFRVAQATLHVNAMLSPLIPFSMWQLERAFCGPERAARVAAWFSVAALLSLVGSGELHLALYGCMFWGAYLTLCLLRAPSRAGMFLVPGATAILGCGALAFAQHQWILAPSVAAHGRSWTESAFFAPRLRDLGVRTISWDDLEHFSYPGVAISGLAFLGVVKAHGRRRLVVFFMVAVVVAYALALIPGLPGERAARAYQLIPLLGYSRVPGRILIIACAALATLAALGVRSLPAPARRWVAVLAVGAISLDAPTKAFVADAAADVIPTVPPGSRLLHLPPFDPGHYSGSVYGFLAALHPGPMTGGYSPFVTPRARDAQATTQLLTKLPLDRCLWKTMATTSRIEYVVVHGALFGSNPLQWPGNAVQIVAALGTTTGFQSWSERDGIWVYRVHAEQIECPQ
jgi:hypothetical protein